MARNISVDLKNLFLSLSVAMEASDPLFVSHQLRTAFISWEIAVQLNLPKENTERLFLAALFHDMGALSPEEKREIHEFETLNPELHCIRGAALFNHIPWLKSLSKIVRNHHTRWEELNEPIDADGILETQILSLSDIVERLIDRNEYILHQTEKIILIITSLSGSTIHSQVIDSFLILCKYESFWLDIVSLRLYSQLLHDGPYSEIALGISEIEDVACLFKNIVDYRSSFTSTHSSGVAECATLLSRKFGFTATEAKLMGIAGNFHDLGKLMISNDILEKDSKLTDREFNVIKQHTYYTFKILNSVKGLEEIASWAAFHHENLDGSGYPFHKGNEELSTYSRIMSVADTHTALTEDRPYRPGMKAEQVKRILQEEVKREHLDNNVVELLLDNYDEILISVREKQNIAKNFYKKRISNLPFTQAN